MASLDFTSMFFYCLWQLNEPVRFCLKAVWTSFDCVCFKQHCVRCFVQHHCCTCTLSWYPLCIFHWKTTLFTLKWFKSAVRDKRIIQYQVQSNAGILHKYDSMLPLEGVELGAQLWMVQTNLMLLPSYRYLVQVTWQQYYIKYFFEIKRLNHLLLYHATTWMSVNMDWMSDVTSGTTDICSWT